MLKNFTNLESLLQKNVRVLYQHKMIGKIMTNDFYFKNKSLFAFTNKLITFLTFTAVICKIPCGLCNIAINTCNYTHLTV